MATTILQNASLLTIPVTGSWTEVDVSAVCPVGTAGLILRIVNESATTDYKFGARNNGSTDDLSHGKLLYANQTFMYVGVDANRIFEAYVGNDLIDFYIQGYFSSDDAVFFTNGVVKATGGNLWTDINCSGDVPAGATALIFEIYEHPPWDFGMRKNGSTDNRVSLAGGHFGVIVGCDVDRIVEVKERASPTVSLIGYLKTGTFNTNAVAQVTPGGGFGDMLSSTAPTGSTGIIVEIPGGEYTTRADLRVKDSTDDFWHWTYHTWFLVGLKNEAGSLYYQGESSDLTLNFFEVGYILPYNPPIITLSIASLSPSCFIGENATSQTFGVSNSGGGTLTYTISDDVAWLTSVPSSGTSTGETDTITVNYSTSGLDVGTYTATITIEDPEASNTPQIISVSLDVTPPSTGMTMRHLKWFYNRPRSSYLGWRVIPV